MERGKVQKTALRREKKTGKAIVVRGKPKTCKNKRHDNKVLLISDLCTLAKCICQQEFNDYNKIMKTNSIRSPKPGEYTKMHMYKAIFSHGLQQPVIKLAYGISTLTSDVGGEMNETFPIQLSTLSNISDIDTLFDEFRILRAESHYVSWFTNTDVSSTQTNRIIGGYTDYGDSATPTSLDDVWSHVGAAEIRNTNQNFSLYYHAVEEPDKEWLPIASSAVPGGWFKYYAGSLPASTTIGAVFMTAEVQFRGVI